VADCVVLEARDLAMQRGEQLLFSDLDLAVTAGRALHLTGPNGSGKTTALRILCGLLMPTRGRLLLAGREVEAGDPGLRAMVGYLGHAEGLKLELTALENLAFARAMAGQPALPDPLALLHRVGLARQALLETRRLSAGQRRRLALARMIAGDYAIWVLDEPFTALDHAGVALLADALEQVLDAGRALVFTSHQRSPLGASRVSVAELGRSGPVSASATDP
jgi:heme exporter protein A